MRQRSLGFGAAPTAAAALAAVILVILAGMSIISARYARALIEGYRELRQAMTATNGLERLQLDEETGIRGYAASGRAELLEPYRLGIRDFDPELNRLRVRLQTIDPRLVGKADKLGALNASWRRAVAVPTLASRPPQRAAGIQISGKVLVDDFRTTTRTLVSDLNTRADALFYGSLNELSRVATIALALVALVAVTTILAAWYLSRLRHRAFEQQRVADELRIFADAIPQMAFVADASGAALYRNARWSEYTGSAEIDEAAFARAIHPDDAAGRAKAWHDATAFEIPYDAQYRLRRHDGTYRWFVGRAEPFRDPNGKIVRFFGTMTDVNDQRLERDALYEAVNAFHQAQLPRTLPKTSGILFDAVYQPAEGSERFGGDWYDVFSFDGRHFMFSMGDVTGHGLQAAVSTGRVRQTIFSLASIERAPNAILERANRVVALQEDTMVTVLIGTIDADTGEFCYASAGHPPALIVERDGAVRELSSGAPPLGLSEILSVPLQRGCLRAGELLVCYTDGIIENDRNVLAGEARLREVVASVAAGESEQTAATIRDRLLGRQSARDDVAILTIRRTAADERPQNGDAA